MLEDTNPQTTTDVTIALTKDYSAWLWAGYGISAFVLLALIAWVFWRKS